MIVEFEPPQSLGGPRLQVWNEQILVMVLCRGSIKWGSKPGVLERVDYTIGYLGLCKRHEGEWIGLKSVTNLMLRTSDEALVATFEGATSEVELHPQRKFVDPCLGALVSAVHAEMVAGFPNGRLFLDSVEQALAAALVNKYAVSHHSVQIYRGRLGSAHLRRIKEWVDAKMEEDLSLNDLAQSVGMSRAHFSRMFRKSTGVTPHQFVLRQRLERAKEMLRYRDTQVLDVAVAYGFKTQQHFAQVFRDMMGVSPTKYRRIFSGSGVTRASDRYADGSPHL